MWGVGQGIQFAIYCQSPECVAFCPEWLLVRKEQTLTGEGSIVWKDGITIV